MGRKRKSTEILEILNETTLPTPVDSDSGDKSPQLPDPVVLPTPILPDVEVTPLPLPQAIPPAPLKRKAKDPLTEELKKIRKNQEDYRKSLEEQEKRLEARLENMLTRKLDFMKPVPVQRPVHNFKPRQPVPIKRFVPPPEEYEDYLTQEEEEEDEQNSLFAKIFS